MPRIKTSTKLTNSFGKRKRGNKKRGRKPKNQAEGDFGGINNAASAIPSNSSGSVNTLAFPQGPVLHGFEGTRREKNANAQMQRVRDANLLKASDPELNQMQVAFTRKLVSLAEVGGLKCPTELAKIDAPEYGIMDMNCINELLAQAPESCPVCENKGHVFRHMSGNDSGFAARLFLVCSQCDEVLVKGYASKHVDGPRSSFDVNRRIVFSMRAVGCGFSELDQFSVLMNMTSAMHHSSFISTVKVIEKELEELIVGTLRFYGNAVKKAHAELGGRDNDDGTRTICVSYDGAWQKRFRGSKIGVGFIIDTLTGLVIDFDVLSTYCFGCNFAPGKDDVDDEGNSLYDKWFESHEDICNKNFDGTPQAMEQELGLILWRRSVELHGLKYGEFLGDGDSSTFDKIVEAEVYGPDFQMQKLDCINHVAKRMGGALREFHDKTPAAKLPDKGRFQKEVIPKLQNYYGSAIKKNIDSAQKIHDAVWATWYHMGSTDENPQHHLCPPGVDSFCFYQRALAQDPPATPPSHADHDHLPKVVSEGIKPIYERLGAMPLLERCRKGQTTNPNESIHHLLWGICPKDKFVSLIQVQLSCIQTVLQFNEGLIGVARTMNSLKLPLSPTACFRMRESDTTKEAKSKKSMTKKGRASRSQRKLAKSKTEAQKRKWEGTVYGYGLDGKEKVARKTKK